MTRNHIGDLPNFFDRYILLSSEDQELLRGLEEYSPEKLFADINKYLSLIHIEMCIRDSIYTAKALIYKTF